MDQENESVWVSKLIAGGCLFVVSTICGVIPFKLAKMFKWGEPADPNNPDKKSSSKAVSLLLCFGGGVLLSTTFLHLLPEINHTIALLTDQELLPKMDFNLGELLMLIGFFVIYLIEELVHTYLHRHQHKLKKAREAEQYEDPFVRGLNVRNSALGKGLPDSQNSVTDLIPAEPVKRHIDEHRHSHSHIPVPHDDEDVLVSSLRGLLIVLALSIHELFEGFAVGLEKTSARVYFMFAAVSAHKFVISFCIGVELMVQRTKLWLAFLYVVIYSLVSAIGIAVGAVLTTGSNGDNLQVLNIILQGLATGTLLYVIFFEVLSKDRSGLWAFLSVLAGFSLMFGLQYIAGITENQGTEGKSLDSKYHLHGVDFGPIHG